MQGNELSLTIEELQRRGRIGDSEAILELGRRVLDFDFCLFGTNRYCEHLHSLHELHKKLDCEIPEECPKCSAWLTET